MIAKAEPIWDKYLPSKPLPATGYKKFKLGQVWAVCTSGNRPYIFRVDADADGGYFNVTKLAGDSSVDFISENSSAAEHSVLLANELPLPGKFEFIPGFSMPALGKFSSSPDAGTDHVKATAEEIVVRIMRKGAEHKKAGRNGQFSQVMVPMEDYQTLFEYFDVSQPPFDGEILVATPVGVVAVYPVNPDGATFTD